MIRIFCDSCGEEIPYDEDGIVVLGQVDRELHYSIRGQDEDDDADPGEHLCPPCLLLALEQALPLIKPETPTGMSPGELAEGEGEDD